MGPFGYPFVSVVFLHNHEYLRAVFMERHVARGEVHWNPGYVPAVVFGNEYNIVFDVGEYKLKKKLQKF